MGDLGEHWGLCQVWCAEPPTRPSLCPQPSSGEGGGLQFASVLSRLGLICMRMSKAWRGGLVLGSLGIFLPLSLPSGRPAAAAAPAKVILCFGTGRRNLLCFISEGSGKEWEPR